MIKHHPIKDPCPCDDRRVLQDASDVINEGSHLVGRGHRSTFWLV
jgi:hypothetical protein